MKYRSVILAIVLTGGCNAMNQAILRSTELNQHVAVESAGPIDPASILFTLHTDGRVTWDGKSLTPDEVVARTSPPSSGLNATPVLLDVDRDAGFHVVRDALAILTGKGKCTNISFLVDCSDRLCALVLPVLGDKGLGYHIYEGQAKEQVLDGWGPKKHLELIISPGNEGTIDVRAVNYCIPGSEAAIYFPPAGEKPEDLKKATDFSWTGEHPPRGLWTPETLKKFLSRRDVVELSPYMFFKITTQEKASDVIRCLSTLKSVAGAVIVPDIPTTR